MLASRLSGPDDRRAETGRRTLSLRRRPAKQPESAENESGIWSASSPKRTVRLRKPAEKRTPRRRASTGAHNRDALFYGFMKSMETYEKTVDAKTILILTTEGELLKYFERVR